MTIGLRSFAKPEEVLQFGKTMCPLGSEALQNQKRLCKQTTWTVSSLLLVPLSGSNFFYIAIRKKWGIFNGAGQTYFFLCNMSICSESRQLSLSGLNTRNSINYSSAWEDPHISCKPVQFAPTMFRASSEFWWHKTNCVNRCNKCDDFLVTKIFFELIYNVKH